MNASTCHRLEGFEPDNVLAFLALLGLLRALDAADDGLEVKSQVGARTAWTLDQPPLRPVLVLRRPIEQEEIASLASKAISALSEFHDFGGRADLNYSPDECRTLLASFVEAERPQRYRADLLAALMNDAATKGDKQEVIDPTPLCLLFGQGHQHFLERLARVPATAEVPPTGRGKAAKAVSAAQVLREALFEPWARADRTFSFRWDPEEDARYALMAGDPTDTAYQLGTQHGANRLAAIGLSALTLVATKRGGRIRASILGGSFGRDGFRFAWPIWRDPATLSGIRAMLGHPGLHRAGALAHLGVEHVLVARRISVGKFMNFSRARPIEEGQTDAKSGRGRPVAGEDA